MQTRAVSGEEDQLSRGIAETRMRLMTEFQEQVRADVVRQVVADTFKSLKGATVSEFVPLFVYRAAREQLADMARAGAV